MKKIYIALTAILLLSQTSCSDFFDQMPQDRLKYDELFETEASIKSALATVYTYIPDEASQRFVATGKGQGTSGAWTSGSDEAEYCWDFVGSQLINNNTLTPSTEMVRTYWKKYYAAIAAANRFIEGASNSPLKDSQKVVRWIDEARALRAMYYYYLVRLYGPVPLVGEKVIDADAPFEEFQIVRSSVDDCVDYIVKEFDAVVENGNLPEKAINDGQNSTGHIDNSVVMAFKLETLMLAASPLYNGSNPHYANLANPDGAKLFPQDISEAAIKAKWAAAAKAASDFIERFVPTTYTLHTEYTKNALDPYKSYREATSGRNYTTNTELIFYRIACDITLMQYDRTPIHKGAPSGDYCASGGLGASLQMVDSYFMANGELPIKGYTDNGSTPVINENSGYEDYDKGLTTTAYYDPVTNELMAPKGVAKAWANREPRFYADITFSGQKWLNTSSGTFYTSFQYHGNSGRYGNGDYCPTGFSVRKGAPLGSWRTEDRVSVLLRLAQVYLNYVEALNESDSSNSDIVKYLNLIRERAGIPTYGYGAGQLAIPSGQDAMRKAIRAERRVELSFENTRYFDVRRWGIAEETENTPLYGMNILGDGNAFFARTKVENRIFEKKMYFFPIPQKDINIDKNLVQNTGWSAE